MCFFSGFKSYVGRVLFVDTKEAQIHLEYHECGSAGEEAPLLSAFSPWMVTLMEKIPEDQYQDFLSADLPVSMNPQEYHQHPVKCLCIYFWRLDWQ